MYEKAALRKRIRSLFGGAGERERQSRLICGHILESHWYREARVVGGYVPMAREADVRQVLADVLATGRTLALPLCGEAPEMTLRRIRALDELVPGRYGILEPCEDAEIVQISDVDLLLTPLEAISPGGIRLGKGGGYYDRLLAQGRPRTIGCALSWQWTSDVPADPWDVPLDACAEEKGIHWFGMTIK